MKKKILYLSAGALALDFLWRQDQHFRFVCVPNEINSKLKEQLSPMFSSFVSNQFLTYEPLIQNIYIGKLHKESFPYEYRREYVTLPDGGQISLEWPQGMDAAESHNLAESKKTLVIVHGLTGGANSYYCKVMIKAAIAEGYTPVVFQARGYNYSELSTPSLTKPDAYNELSNGLNRIRAEYPDHSLYIVAFSIGANATIRMMSDHQDKFPELKALAAVSMAIDINDAADRLGHGVVEEYFIGQFIDTIFEPNIDVIVSGEQQYGYTYEDIKKSKTLRQLNERFTCKVEGRKDSHELFDLWKLERSHLENLKVPTFFMHAKDDDIAPSEFFPVDIFEEKDNLFFAETKHGGHVGWFHGMFPPRPWFYEPVMKYFSNF